jgi:predicted  nucleic acid-binding Zn-ribbon protein
MLADSLQLCMQLQAKDEEIWALQQLVEAAEEQTVQALRQLKEMRRECAGSSMQLQQWQKDHADKRNKLVAEHAFWVSFGMPQ